jgi:hypothetical protein
MTRGDALVEHGADRLEELSQSARAAGGVKGKLAGELANDAAFLRKLKPSLMVQRARGDRPIEPSPAVPDRPQQPKRRGSGLNPFLIAALGLAAGILAAKVIDWRGHAHPRD